LLGRGRFLWRQTKKPNCVTIMASTLRFTARLASTAGSSARAQIRQRILAAQPANNATRLSMVARQTVRRTRTCCVPPDRSTPTPTPTPTHPPTHPPRARARAHKNAHHPLTRPALTCVLRCCCGAAGDAQNSGRGSAERGGCVGDGFGQARPLRCARVLPSRRGGRRHVSSAASCSASRSLAAPLRSLPPSPAVAFLPTAVS